MSNWLYKPARSTNLPQPRGPFDRHRRLDLLPYLICFHTLSIHRVTPLPVPSLGMRNLKQAVSFRPTTRPLLVHLQQFSVFMPTRHLNTYLEPTSSHRSGLFDHDKHREVGRNLRPFAKRRKDRSLEPVFNGRIGREVEKKDQGVNRKMGS